MTYFELKLIIALLNIFSNVGLWKYICELLWFWVHISILHLPTGIIQWGESQNACFQHISNLCRCVVIFLCILQTLLSKATYSAFRLYSFFFISMCVPWELNPQPFALLTQCTTTEPQEHFVILCAFFVIYVMNKSWHEVVCFCLNSMYSMFLY